MSIGIAYNPCKNCKEMDKCSICELTYYRKGYIKSPTADVVEIPEGGIGNLSDGYHTFNELYHHRAILFSMICNSMPEKAWKSKLHDTGDMFDGMFIVGIETPEGQATYHYDIKPYWNMFKVKELEKAPKWDGHTPQDAIDRIAKISVDVVEVVRCKDCKWWKRMNGDKRLQCFHGHGLIKTTENDYCSRGERRTKMKKVEWQEEWGELVPVCPYCNEWVHDKERCVFCKERYEWYEPPNLPKPTVVKYEGFVIVQTPSNHIQIYDAKDGHIVYHASCTKKLTEDELREHAGFLKQIRKGDAENVFLGEEDKG